MRCMSSVLMSLGGDCVRRVHGMKGTMGGIVAGAIVAGIASSICCLSAVIGYRGNESSNFGRRNDIKRSMSACPLLSCLDEFEARLTLRELERLPWGSELWSISSTSFSYSRTLSKPLSWLCAYHGNLTREKAGMDLDN